jgi:GDP-L-fucose synthase
MDAASRIYIAGLTTMYGQALDLHLTENGCAGILHEPDHTDLESVRQYFAEFRPDYVFIVGGKSGGIAANQQFPADLITDNLMMAHNVMTSAYEIGVTKLLYLASSCVYPRLCPQPMKESDLMSGPLEPTNAAYATAKLTGLQLVQSYRKQHNAPFIAVIPTNIFGPGDKFDPDSSHVVVALIRRMDEAKSADAEEIEVWGTGSPLREFMAVEDLVRGCTFLMDNYDDDTPINLGCGESLSIAKLATAIKQVVGFKGEIKFDITKTDGMPEKSLDSTKLLTLGWKPEHTFAEALQSTYDWYYKHIRKPRHE